MKALLVVVAILVGCSPAGTIERVSVSSSAIDSIGYDQSSQTLQIEFVGGEVYDYQGVPPDVYKAMMAAPSKGKFFHSRIKSRYGAKRL